ncbi:MULTISPECIES: nucleoside triphosphate pyrophosphohydrolase [Sphingobacterium]|uniref:Nucleoside triphosphate pyrophosphohydrolase n=1 Tax=Sphingobacterium cellulitidis TaxID=1768011 RepID=A0A8H9KUC5_9SPHI|nr:MULTISPECIES: nucleoside triphosphate pyrophosphohydrolase [Sphingobacterium]MBA8986539.1 XTP/dITP diphosphohydrolase [Sphingobacterium soli]OYD42583.1 nucleoside triphosphate pyrophosphohydrolase [Sphingobacterium cellulitidis]WFB61901.1 nucleoside triphosphate pyrophosphohydrolase [Sphingobacterium sp. WM]GGE21013.1 nucleoside triphosphate pyrophosphohydrolase [Sphingobacterium soli]
MAHIPPPTKHTAPEAFERLLDVLNTLRIECPWDRKQTMESLRHLTIEELYELTDAILEKDYQEIKKELGDILMHLVFYAKIADEENQFNIVDVLNAVCDKLITRHPHIYSDIQVKDDEEVKQNWESIKLKEGNKSVLQGVPQSLPALVKAYRIQDKVRGVGFDWEDKTEVWNKVEEELAEFKAEFDLKTGAIDQEKAEAEFGDLLFSLINYARHIGINPENALEKTNKKFIHRFTYLEAKAAENGQVLKDMTLEEMDVYWNEAKKLK